MAVMDRGSDRDRDSNTRDRDSAKPSGKILKLRPMKKPQSNSQSKSPNPDSRPRRVASLDPYAFHSTIDIIEELTYNKDTYAIKGDTSGCQLTVYNFPSSLLTCIDRIRGRISPRPGLNLTFACCVMNGLEVLNNNEDLKALQELKWRFANISAKVNGYLSEAVAIFLRSYAVSIANPVHSTVVRRQNLYLPEHVKESLGSTCLDLGISHSAIIYLCVMISLIDQEGIIHTQQHDEMSRAVDNFFASVKVRREIVGVILDYVEGQSH